MRERVLYKTAFLKYVDSFKKVPEVTILSTLNSMDRGARTSQLSCLKPSSILQLPGVRSQLSLNVVLYFGSQRSSTHLLRWFANKWSLVLKSQIFREMGNDQKKMVSLLPSSRQGRDLPLLFWSLSAAQSARLHRLPFFFLPFFCTGCCSWPLCRLVLD